MNFFEEFCKTVSRRRFRRPHAENTFPVAAMSRVAKTVVDLDTKRAEGDDAKTKGKQNEANRSYAKLHLAGDSALQHGYLDAAEEHFASALKQIHDRDSPRLHEEEECLRKLGTVYVRRGAQTKDGQDFAKATALYNAALARKGDNHLLIDSIKEAERLFLYHTVGIDCKPSPYESDIDHKNRLEKYRAEIKARLETIHNNHNPYQYDDDDPVVHEVEMKRAESVRDLFKDISEQRKDFITDLVEECMKTIGPPPCQYAMVGLGSQATELVTPYSDLEFAILMEENKDTPENREYFLNLTCYLYLKIINLGETILPSVAIKSLNDFQSKDPAGSWFYDSVTPRGFAFDGAMPWASKTPFGRERTKTKPAVSLIQTPAGMAEFQRHDDALTYGYHLSTVLRYVSYLTGDQILVDDYTARVIQELWAFDEQDKATVAQRFARVSLTHTMQEHKHQQLTEETLDVKKEIYRFPTVAVVNLGLLGGVYATSVWDAIKEMEEAGVVTKENAHHLQVLVSISGELRLRTYLELGGQKENLSGLTAMRTQQDDDDETLLKSVFYVPDQKMLFRYFYTARPLKQHIIAVSTELNNACFEGFLGRETLFYDASTLVKADICANLLQFKAMVSVTEKLQVEVEEGKYAETVLDPMGSLYLKARLQRLKAWRYCKLGYQRQAISCLEEELRVQQQLFGYDAICVDIAATYQNLGLAWGVLDPWKSLKYYKLALAIREALLEKDAVDPEIPRILHNIGAQLADLGKFKKAISYFESGMNMLKTIHGENAAHPDIAISLAGLGSCWSRLGLDKRMEQGDGDHKKAITYDEEALRMKKAIYGPDTAHPAIAISIGLLGNSVCAQGDHVKALSLREQALEMNKFIYGSDTPHPHTARSLGNLGLEWWHLGDHKKAISYYEQALQMEKVMEGGDKARHPDIAHSLYRLGMIWFDAGNSDKARGFYEQALKMYQDLYGQTTPHPDASTLLSNLGVLREKSGDNFKAISFYEEALKMIEKIFRNSKEHPYIALLLCRLGSTYRKVREYLKSLQYYERALEIFKGIHGQEAAHPSIVGSLSELAVVHQNLGDHTKAIQLYEDALDMTRVIHCSNKTHGGDGTRHPDIAHALYHMGRLLSDAGDSEKAIGFYEQALQMYQKLYGPTTPYHHTAISLSCMDKSGDNSKPISYYEESLKMLEEVLYNSKEHPDIALLLGELGSVCHKAGNYTKSVRYFERALEINKGIHGQDSAQPAIAKSLSNLAAVYEDLEDYAISIMLYKDALHMMGIIHSTNDKHPDILELNSKLDTVCNKLGDRENARENGEQASALKMSCAIM
ncbi:TTC28 [Branchiostoma lanceolatum]|uniref:TTC28 protein n=1 Tax=Branchiostoma lanceolatum TaxID=7740 RepID=A0A8K0ENV8_BRALA|nr:TTC28 [Branchiostoma lanceolatum]